MSGNTVIVTVFLAIKNTGYPRFWTNTCNIENTLDLEYRTILMRSYYSVDKYGCMLGNYYFKSSNCQSMLPLSPKTILSINNLTVLNTML